VHTQHTLGEALHTSVPWALPRAVDTHRPEPQATTLPYPKSRGPLLGTTFAVRAAHTWPLLQGGRAHVASAAGGAMTANCRVCQHARGLCCRGYHNRHLPKPPKSAEASDGAAHQDPPVAPVCLGG